METIPLVLGVLGLGLGLGVSYLKFIPRQVVKVTAILATVVVVVLFWNMLGLPAVDLLDAFTSSAFVAFPALGFLAGERVGSFF